MKLKSEELKKANYGKYINAFMRCALAFVCILIVFAFPCAAAEENAVLVENYRLIEEYSGKLGEEINSYGTLDTTADKSISKNVSTKINIYRKKLLDLQSNADVGKRSLEKEIKLFHMQGSVLGRISWIYYVNIPTLEGSNSAETVLSAYEKYTNEIAAASEPDVLSVRSESMCSELNKIMYREIVKNLALSDDTLESASLIAGALEEIEITESSALDGAPFALIKDGLVSELKLQRARDMHVKQLEDIFFIVRPDENFSSNESVALFTYKMKNAKKISEMNEVLRSTVYSLIAFEEDGNDCPYARLYVSRLNLELSELLAAANKKGDAVSFFESFSDYRLLRDRADTKDIIHDIVFKGGDSEDETLISLEAAFNSDGGYVDGANDAAALKNEILRAEAQKNLYDLLKKAIADITVILGEYSTEELYKRAEQLYSQNRDAVWDIKNNDGFSDSCQKTLDGAEKSFASIADEAKVQRYLGEHKQIMQKAKEDLKASDETDLRRAIAEYISLELPVREMLLGQIMSICDKYNTVLGIKVRGMLPDDALYADLCEEICRELSEISRADTAQYYSGCDLALKKAETLKVILLYYRSIAASENYKVYTEDERTELMGACTLASERLTELDRNGEAYEMYLGEISDESKILLDRTNECVRVRAAANGSSITKVNELLFDACTKIKASNDKNEMIAIADKAIFKIKRELSREEITNAAEQKTYIIAQYKYLTDDEKEDFFAKITSLKNSSVAEASSSENMTVLNFIKESFFASLDGFVKSAGEKDLAAAQVIFEEKIKKDTDKYKNNILGLAHLSEQRREEIFASVDGIKVSFLSEAVGCKSTHELEELYAETLKKLSAAELSAKNENLTNYKKTVASELGLLYALKDNYSPENAKRLEEIIKEAEEKLASLPDISDCTALLKETLEKIEKIPDLLDDAKNGGKARFDDFLSSCTAYSGLYSEANIKKIEKIFSDAMSSLEEYTDIATLSEVLEIIDTAVNEAKKIPRSAVYTQAGASALQGEAPKYPDGYLHINDGYWGVITAPNGISYGAQLSITDISASSNFKTLQSQIHKAVKDGSLVFYGTATDEKMTFLKSCVISSGIDITLSGQLSGDSNLKLLLPASFSSQNILGLVFVGEDGKVEFYDGARSGDLLSVNLKHFSRFYIVSEKVTDISALIVCLGLLFLAELVLFALILSARIRRKRKERAMLPANVASFVPFMTLDISGALRVLPQNGVTIAVILSVGVLALGCAIAVLAHLELKHKSSDYTEYTEAESIAAEPEYTVEYSPLLASAEKREGVLSDGSASAEYGMLESHSFAEELEAFDWLSETEQVSERSEPDEDIPASLRQEVNLDDIAKRFNDGDIVTIESLKEKRLIKKRTRYVKILARGTLNKSLIVYANDFSHSAEQLLVSAGGEAVRVKSSFGTE